MRTLLVMFAVLVAAMITEPRNSKDYAYSAHPNTKLLLAGVVARGRG